MIQSDGLRVLLLHNHYRQFGGEDVVFATESRLLSSRGHAIRTLVESNTRIAGVSPARLAGRTIWSLESFKRVTTALDDFLPDIVHVHNTFPLLSPSVYQACSRKQVPIVQTIHNYRLLCANGLLFRDGSVCRICVDKRLAWPGVFHRCYRRSAAQTAVISAAVTTHQYLGTWGLIDRFIAPSRTVRDELAGRIAPLDRFVIKPHTIDPPIVRGLTSPKHVAYVGRLSPEKGVDTLLDAWRDIEVSIPLLIVGDGPTRSSLMRQCDRLGLKDVHFLGQKPRQDALDIMASSYFLVVPSICLETFGLTVIESFALGVPVIASRIGGLAESVTNGRTGLLANPGDPGDLSQKMRTLLRSPSLRREMGGAARLRYEAVYAPDRNYEQLHDIYTSVLVADRPSP